MNLNYLLNNIEKLTENQSGCRLLQNKIQQYPFYANNIYQTIKMKLNIKKLDSRAVLPAYGSEYSAGADLYACLDEPVTVNSGEAYLFHTGVAMEIPEGYAGLVFARSGLAVKKGLAPSNKVGVIDADYRGEIMVSLFNHSKEPRVIEHGERIAQLVIVPFLAAQWNEVDELSETVRGEGGFGSTGRK